jgi:pyridoxal phosphate enzyme (YggS family)
MMMALNNILARVSSAETAAQREPGSVRLIAVSKVQPNHRVSDTLQKEYRCFGENTVQEAEGKWPGFRQKYDDIDLHLIGPLQSNKARKAFELFQSIHTLDRLKLANTFARLAQEMGQCPDLFIQVNTGEEPQKAGVMPGEVDAFVAECASLDLPVKGLMCIPPVEEEASLHFALLAKMAKRNGLSGLSMGMSSDFERAISFGATHIRVGSAIFGDRVPN